ncbi:centrosomin isoform X9 [Nasonia vitripennis]|nr:centrosomin isoform X9 [Nasonia vitripennis]
MDQTIPMVNGANAKSPGKTSPVGGGMVGGQGIGGPGRTMKECEDELGALKKANFNLKLRIYFLEERMGITSADEDPVRKNIELKVVNESLRKDLIEKQELLSQAAKAIELYEEQKQVSARNQAQYQHTLEQERARADSLEKELEEYRGRLTDATFYEETFGITPEKALEYKEKLHQVEEIKSSLESELKQLSASLEEERNWAQELENERDQLRDRLETEIASKEKLSIKRDREIESLNDRVRELEEELFKRDNSLQQFRKEIIEKDKVIEEKTCLLEDKCKAYEEVTSVAEKRKKQIDQLRLSVKTRDDALTDLNNKNRSLLSQFENTYAKRSTSPNSPSVFMEESQHLRKTFALNSPTKSFNGSLDFEPSNDRSRAMFELHNSLERRNSQELRKELEEKEREVKKQVELTKQLSLKLDTVQQSADVTDQKLKKLETDHRKAIQMIQGFMKRHEQLEDKQAKKDRRIMELEGELSRLKNENAKTVRSSVHSSIRRNLSTDLVDDPERDYNGQQRFEEMESKINDLRDQIDEIKAEKNLLEKQIQIESEELRDRLQDKDLKIECLVCEKNSIKDELQGKSEELDKLKEAYDRVSAKSDVQNPAELEKLREELAIKNLEIEEKSQQVERLTKELQVKTQNLQQLVNTELWSKNKEIAKLHNHMTASQYQEKSRNKSLDGAEKAGAQLNTLIKELNDIGIQVTFMNDIIQLNYVNSDKPVDVLTLTNYIHKLIAQKNDLEKEVDYLKWLKLVSKPANDSMTDVCDSTTERDKQYCELLRTHLKELMKFMKEMLRSTDETTDTVNNKQKKIVLDALMNSKILSDDFLNALEGMRLNEQDAAFDRDDRIDGSVRKSKSENFIDSKNQFSTPSDSEAFSEPDRMVSLARMGLPDIKQKSATRSRPSKFAKTFSDSEDSIDYHPCHKVYQSDVSDFDANRQILELKDINSFLYSELNALRNEVTKTRFDDAINGKLSLLLNKLDKSRSFCEKLQNTLERKIHECHTLKKEMAKQKAELTLYKESTDRKTTEMLITLNKENDMLRSKIKKLEEDNEEAKAMILRLTRELDHLTLTHSQILVENTKLTNDKLRLEQEVRKTESRYDVTVRTLQEKFHKEVTDLNQINESHRARVQELETTNKELRRHVVICEASDSAPSSSGISSIPPDVASKQACDDILNEYHTYNGSPYWLPVTYPLSSGRSKSSCSPDLGIESDAAVTSTRPLKDTLKITESMTNLLSDDDNCNNNPGLRDIDGDSPLPIEGGLLYYSLDEVQSLKEENVALKRRLMKTRRALEDTFQHLSASNKNKKNVEKAITKQLMITKSVLKKTRNYEDTHYEN